MTWPSTYPVGSLGYMQDRIADELMRSDLSSQISVAINDAITTYQRDRFRFNETFTCQFVTVVGQQNYNAGNTTFTDASFPTVTFSPRTFFEINDLLITIPPAVFKMSRIQPDEILILTQTGTQMGQPYNWAYDNETIMLYPIPSAGGPGQINSFVFNSGGNGYDPAGQQYFPNAALSGGSGNGATANITVVAGTVLSGNFQIVNPGSQYQVGDQLSSTVLGPGSGFQLTVSSINNTAQGPYVMTLLGHFAYPPPDGTTQIGLSDTTNRWMLDGEKLIRSRAKYNLAQHVTRNMPMAQMMSPDEPQGGALTGATYDAYRRLRAEVTRVTQRGVVRPMYWIAMYFAIGGSLSMEVLPWLQSVS